MPRGDYKRCKGCNRLVSEVGQLSHVRLCASCGMERLRENNLQIHAGSGAFHEYRRYRTVVREFGPRVAAAMVQTGILDGDLIDATRVGT